MVFTIKTIRIVNHSKKYERKGSEIEKIIGLKWLNYGHSNEEKWADGSIIMFYYQNFNIDQSRCNEYIMYLPDIEMPRESARNKHQRAILKIHIQMIIIHKY